MKSICVLLLISCFFYTNLFGQEDVSKDTVRYNNALKMPLKKDFVSLDKETSIIKSVETNEEQTQDAAAISGVHPERPFYIPTYYVNPSPMFYGDYVSYGLIFHNLYGSGSQLTIPGIGRVNQVSFIYQRQLNAFWGLNAGINATKYNFTHSVGQSFGVFGSLTYHPSEMFYLKAFGSYSPNSRYNFNNSYYGMTIGYDFTNRFGMEVGIQRYYDIQKGWQIAPIATPYYKFNKFSIGIDMGGMIYNIIQNSIGK